MNAKYWLNNLLKRYPDLKNIQNNILTAYDVIKQSYENGGQLLIAGNGGSASDAEHLVGELMKGFKLKREINEELKSELIKIDADQGLQLSNDLAEALPAINLNNHFALNSAFLNDIGGDGWFAQQVLGYGKKNDVYLGITCSGNSSNVIKGAICAKAKGLKVIALTGESGGNIVNFSDIAVCVPRSETFEIQELHLPIYHCIALMLESYFFDKGEEQK